MKNTEGGGNNQYKGRSLWRAWVDRALRLGQWATSMPKESSLSPATPGQVKLVEGRVPYMASPPPTWSKGPCPEERRCLDTALAPLADPWEFQEEAELVQAERWSPGKLGRVRVSGSLPGSWAQSGQLSLTQPQGCEVGAALRPWRTGPNGG